MADYKKDDKINDVSESFPITEDRLDYYVADSNYRKQGDLPDDMLLLYKTVDNKQPINLMLLKGERWVSTSVNQLQLFSNYTSERGNHDYKRQQQLVKHIHGTSGYKAAILTTNSALMNVNEGLYVQITRLISFQEIREKDNKYSRTSLTFEGGTVVIINLGIEYFTTRFDAALEQLDSYRCSYDMLANYEYIGPTQRSLLQKHLLDTISPLSPFIQSRIKQLKTKKDFNRYSLSFYNKEMVKITIQPAITNGLLTKSDFPDIKF
ncbi:hypothetical protein [uncultured Vagococcus sp.]|uniref:hypothetical protein n=1 Tax=uncultured Vagococcus sp. TaxID=189676 RepID=UPI0028D157B5|nr:hypothetical protein [uncultured Vagococcus sp.]